MPTPFTHLAYAQRLAADHDLPTHVRADISAHLSAYLLGSVAADCHGLCRLRREDTHFYAYDRPMEDHPYRVLLTRYPELGAAAGNQRAFTLGYISHLAIDEVWALKMMKVHFVEREWAPRRQRFLMLHALLIEMDERDLASLAAWIAPTFAADQPVGWSPFIGDDALTQWQQIVHRQIIPGGASETYDIIAPRVNLSIAEVAAMMADRARIDAELWAHIPRAALAEIEAEMYATARDQMTAY